MIRIFFYTAVLNSYLEYSLDGKYTVNLSFQSTSMHFSSFFESYCLKPRLYIYFFCIFICALMFLKEELIENFRQNRFSNVRFLQCTRVFIVRQMTP